MKVGAIKLLAILAAAGPSSATASDIECYDLKIRAKAIAQVPTVYPNDPDYIVISWPWFVDLKVTKVLEGELSQSRITVLAVLHAPYITKTRTWLLRHNTIGTLNLIRSAEPLPRCAINAAAVQPYIRPAVGKTLDDYRREGEAEYMQSNDEE
jgi:hypothetical protein